MFFFSSFASRPPFLNIVYEANGTFAVNLLRMLCNNNPSKNVCYSPINISSALAMFLLGVKGNTEIQISEVSCLSNPQPHPHIYFACIRAVEKEWKEYIHLGRNMFHGAEAKKEGSLCQ